MKKLTPPLTLLENAFKIYFKKQNFFYLIKIVLIGLFVIFLSVLLRNLPWALAKGITVFFGKEVPVLLFILLVALLVAGMIFGFVWFGSSFILAITKISDGKNLRVRQTFKEARLIWWRFLGTSLLVALIMAVGYLLFIVPGLIFSVWFAFALFITVTKGSHAFESVKKSKELVGGYFWPVAGRLFTFTILNLLLRIVFTLKQIEMIGSVVLIVTVPYFMLLPYLLYKDLLKVKGR